MAVVTKLVRDPLGFIHNNLLIVTDPNVWEPQAQHLDGKRRARLTLIDMVAEGYSFASNVQQRALKKSFAAKITGRASKSRASGLYRVVMAAAGTASDDVFQAYICPFRANASLPAMVGNDCNIMITAEMTGCTFGIGSATSNGSRMVMHANSSNMATGPDAAGMQPQAIAQAQSITSGLGLGATRWSPSDYRRVDNATGEDIRSTLIGVRGKTGWDFYAQKYDAQSADRVMLDLVRVG